MKNTEIKISSSFILLATLFFTGCKNKAYQYVRIWNYKQCSFDSSLSKQTLNGLSVELEPLRAGFYFKYPELFKFEGTKVPMPLQNANLIYPASAGGSWIHTFCYGANFLIAMKLKITNNTSHVLSLKNTNMYYKGIEGDSVAALTTVGDPTLVQIDVTPAGKQIKEYAWRPKSFVENDGSLVSIATNYEAIYEKTRPRNELLYPVGIGAEVIRQNINAYKLLGNINLDIQPATDYSGILFFPTLLSDKKFSIKLDNFLVFTDTDKYIPAKTGFEFRFKPDMGSVWLDQNKSQWVEGKPLGTKEYYDKVEKKWKVQ